MSLLETYYTAPVFFKEIISEVELERLQTLPDGYTEGIPESQRRKVIGNGCTAEVITHILKGVKEHG